MLILVLLQLNFFFQNILKGVEYLTGMLSIQRSKNANFSCNDEQTYNLVKEGKPFE